MTATESTPTSAPAALRAAASGSTAPRPTSSGPQDPSAVLTDSPRRALRRRLVLIVVIAVVVLMAIALVVIRSSASASSDPLDITNPAPQGSRALAQVLERHGVEVVATDSLRTTRSAIGEPGGTTVLVYDPQGLMTSAQRTALLNLGTDVVAVQPELLALDDIAPGLGLAGQLSGTFTAGCALEEAQKAGTVTGVGLGYRTLDDDASSIACFTRKGVSGLVRTSDGSRSITVLGLGSTLENGTIASRGDAALALNLLGHHPRLVWYISSYADLQEGTTPTLAELTPGWVTPLIALLLIAAVAAIVWRGRRFGPIVIENLPVVVRASETMEGRARLYAKANARLRALDALRVGTIERLARLVGLPRSATVDQVIDAVAARLGRDRGDVAAVLRDAIPGNDAALVHFSDLLLTLEADTVAAVAR